MELTKSYILSGDIDTPMHIPEELVDQLAGDQLTKYSVATVNEKKHKKRSCKHAWIIDMKSGFNRSELDIDSVISYLVCHLKDITNDVKVQNFNNIAILVTWPKYIRCNLMALEMTECILNKIKVRDLIQHLSTSVII